MAIPTFNKLWASYPDRKSMEKRCFNKQKTWQKLFDNYCAISLSESFIRSGILVSHAPGNKCWSHSGARHLLLAEDFAKWLKTSPPPGFGKMEEIPPQNFQSLLKGRTGVIFFKDYYQRGSQKFANRTGDHIDLWNKNKIRVVPFDNLLIFRIFLSSICQLRGQRTGLLRKLIDS